MWIITVVSKRNLSDKDRDFMAELVSEEARKTIKSYRFVLHDIVESKRYCKLLIEGTENAITNLLSVIRDNLHLIYNRFLLSESQMILWLNVVHFKEILEMPGDNREEKKFC